MNLRARVTAASAKARQEQYEEALRDLTDLISEVGSSPEAAPIWSSLAYVYHRKGEINKAIDAASTAIAHQNTEPAYFFKRGRYHFKIGNYPEAEADFTSTLALCDAHQSDYYRCAAHLARAAARVKQGKRSEARADLEQVPDDNPMWMDGLKSKSELVADCDA